MRRRFCTRRWIVGDTRAAVSASIYALLFLGQQISLRTAVAGARGCRTGDSRRVAAASVGDLACASDVIPRRPACPSWMPATSLWKPGRPRECRPAPWKPARGLRRMEQRRRGARGAGGADRPREAVLAGRGARTPEIRRLGFLLDRAGQSRPADPLPRVLSARRHRPRATRPRGAARRRPRRQPVARPSTPLPPATRSDRPSGPQGLSASSSDRLSPS